MGGGDSHVEWAGVYFGVLVAGFGNSGVVEPATDFMETGTTLTVLSSYFSLNTCRGWNQACLN
jgi:hypothetical protein